MADKLEFKTGLQLEGLEKGLKTAEKRVESLQKRMKQLQADYDLYVQKGKEAAEQAEKAELSGDAGYAQEYTKQAIAWDRKAETAQKAMLKVQNDLNIATQEAAEQAQVVANAQAELNARKAEEAREAARAAQIEQEKTELAQHEAELSRLVSEYQDDLKKQIDEATESAGGLEQALELIEKESEELNLFPDGELKQKLQAILDEMAAYAEERDNAARVADAEAEAAAEAERQAEAFEKIKNAGDGIDKMLNSVKKRIMGLMKRVLFFSLITKGLNEIRKKFSAVVAQNNEVTNAVSRLKGAFNTLATPLINAVIPALVNVLNWVTKIVTAIIMIISKLTGKSFDAMKGEAKKADKSAKGGGKKSSTFASFDTINQLDSGSGGGADKSLANLEAAYDLTELTDEEFKKILKQVGLIGAGMLAWTYRKEIFEGLKNILKKCSEYLAEHPGLLQKIVGWAMVIIGLVLAIKGYFEAWTEGINWDNFQEILGGLFLIITGLYLALGPVAAAWAAVAGGIALVILAIHDMQNGINWQNLTTLILGVALVVGGLYVALGSTVAGLAAVAGGVLMVIKAVSDMIKQGPTLQNTILLVAGCITTIIGLLMSGHTTLAIVAAAIMAVVGIAATAGGQGENILQHLKEAVDGFKEFFTKIFAGDIDGALEALKNGFKGLGNVCIDIFEGLVKAAAKAVNKVIELINKISFGPVPEWVPVIGGKTFGLNIPTIPVDWSLPRLATGAVIPPNRQFAAVLGDQKSGTNIEAPLSTIVDAFRAVQGEQNITIKFNGSLAELAKLLAPEINVANNRAGRPLGGTTW